MRTGAIKLLSPSVFLKVADILDDLGKRHVKYGVKAVSAECGGSLWNFTRGVKHSHLILRLNPSAIHSIHGKGHPIRSQGKTRQ